MPIIQHRRGQQRLYLWGIAVAAFLLILIVYRIRRIDYDESILEVDALKDDLAQPRRQFWKGELWRRRNRLQTLEEGTGPLFYRSYQVEIAQPRLSKEALFSHITTEINNFVPWAMLAFQKVKGAPQTLQVGDEFVIYLLRFYRIRVRVTKVDKLSFSLHTLQGHVEAGEIQFALSDHPKKAGALLFEITARFSSSGSSSHILYQIFGLSRYAQTLTWVTFCHQVAVASGGTVIDKIHVMTHQQAVTDSKSNPHSGAPATAKVLQPWQKYKPRLEKIRTLEPNFDINKRTEFTTQNGWNIDDYQIGLPGEKAGMPEKNGSWEQAKQILQNYEFPDPSLITGIFLPDDPIDKRVMLLRARFLFFTFWFNVKINSVIDEEITEKRGKAKVWGFSYITLADHFEMGEITFTVLKFLESGEVEFRIHAYSKTGRIRNPFYRIGFRLFGRKLQKRFAYTALDRMQKLVINRLTAQKSA